MSTSPLEPFVLLADPSTYVACSSDTATDADDRGYWVPFFVRHFEVILNLALEVELSRGRESGEAGRRIAACRDEFRERCERFSARHADWAARGERVTILTLGQWRDGVLRKHGLIDPFELLKARENTKMLPLLGTVCRQLDAMPLEERVRAVVEGVFAGNIFDMGASATTKAFLGESPDFFAVRSKLSPRPWLIDDYDAFSAALIEHGRRGLWKKVVFFVDNAGSDFLLGAVPMIRFLAAHGARVVLVANERPTLNDMTIAEVRQWWPRILAEEPSIGALPIELVSSGTGEPLIDLLGVSRELNDAARGADLVILEGMGRGVESNLDARFTCAAANLAMIKDEHVAWRHRGKVYDCVCQYRER